MKPAREAAPMAEDQAAEFAALQASALGENAAPAEAETPIDISLAGELAGIAGALLAAVGPMFPSVKALYTEEVTKGAAAAIAAVCVKHGWLSGGLMGEYAEEITALMICGPLAIATSQAVKVDLAAMKAKSGAAPSVAVSPAPTLQPEPSGPAPIVLERG